MLLQGLIGVVLLAGSTCAVVPSTGQVIVGEYAECRAAAIEVRFQLTELVTSTTLETDPGGEMLAEYRENVRDFASAQADTLAACQEGNAE